ncbi:ABC transporter permease [Clostridium sp. CTA-5]
MYSKIAIGNVKKSFKDYAIYFLTLTLAVCIFYSFNSIESQKAILEINKSDTQYIKLLNDVIAGISVFVSVILGGLILYANNFLIKKRKKELGTYMILGMGKNKISKILILETFLVGLLSLASGLLLGFVAAQGLSVFTAKLFDVGMSEYKFSISTFAIVKTALYFGMIFLLVMIFNTIVISKYKIIDLLRAGKKNESIKFKNPIIYLMSFTVCIVSLGFAYKMILSVGLDVKDIRFTLSILLGIIGTLLFFFSLSGFGLYIIEKNKKIYFKELNIFILKQINSKINTNFLSMAIMCLMLFLTITILSTGIAFKSALESSLKDTTPFDASATLYIDENNNFDSIEENLKNIRFEFDNGEKYIYFKEYDSKVDIKELISAHVEDKNKSKLDNYKLSNVHLIKLSDYNKIKKMKDKESVTLKNNEVLILSNNSDIVSIINKFLENNHNLNINKKEYTIKNDKTIEDSLITNLVKSNICTLIVNDEVINNFKPLSDNLNIKYSEKGKEKSQEKISKFFNSFKSEKIDFNKTDFINGITKEEVYSENKGMTIVILFVGIYLGIIFLISSMAVLALQQLSEASDSADRYKSLKKIGANDKMINKTIFIQTLIYFSLPIGLAFIHSVISVKVCNNFISMFNNTNILGNSLITALVFLIVYIGYFYATYTGYKNIITSSK